ncbi:hypothetical protein E4663_06725 [Halobacillus salinus]|uniref:Hemolysin XhlA n=2 Tax=Halobacillus salinus TaxID=192814 RepID=A0A4Z0H4G4_9BACI|nr:hypothetical protein E4663_06725 [Halobacillus salinus]
MNVYFRGPSMDKEYVTRQEFKELDDKVDELKNEHTKTKQRVYNVEQKLDRIENNTTWILRLILGAIIVAILALIIQSPETGITIGGVLSGK